MAQLSSQFTRDDFEARIERFEEDWLSEVRTGPPPRFEAYLPPAQLVAEEGFGRSELLVELIMIDLECRWREKSHSSSARVTNGSLPEHPKLDDYIDRYPELGTVAELPAELIAQEYQVRKRWGDQPSHDDFRERFKSSGDKLIELISDVDGEIEESGFTVHCPYCDTPVEFRAYA